MDLRKLVQEKRNRKCLELNNASNLKKDVCCDVVMIISNNALLCSICGRNQVYTAIDTDIACNKRAYIKVGNSNKFYNTQQDSSITQRDNIKNHLNMMQAQYEHYQFPASVLNNVVEQYSQIQQYTVKRGNAKNEILAALIFYECNNQNCERKCKDVATFMQLKKRGFSQGKVLLRELVNLGVLNIKLLSESSKGYTERYLEIFETKYKGISKYCDFIIKIIYIMDDSAIDCGSLISSKVIGCIWYINIKCDYGLTIKELENECDHTKCNTIKKFYDIIVNNFDLFYDILVEYGFA
jgi:transcription initiation factor TFIIIB Brf1 subunit/transcription initiation factor TFIIB